MGLPSEKKLQDTEDSQIDNIYQKAFVCQTNSEIMLLTPNHWFYANQDWIILGGDSSNNLKRFTLYLHAVYKTFISFHMSKDTFLH